MYRIHWKNYLTGNTGYGKRKYPKEQAEALANEMNKTSANIKYWAESAEKKKEKNNG